MEISKIPIDDYSLGKFWGGVFFHPRFVDPASRLLNLRGDALMIQIDGRPVCAVNLLLRRRGPVRIATVPLMFQYFGFLPIDPESFKDFYPQIEKFLSARCDYSIFDFPPPVLPETFEKSNWSVLKTTTLHLGYEDLLTWGIKFRDDVMNKIRKAARERVKIEEADSLPEELWAMTYGRRNLRPPIKPSVLRQWCQELLDCSILRIFEARIDERPVAFRGELFFGDFAYDWIAGSDPRFHPSGANQLLMAETGKQIAASGVRTWDLVGGQIKSILEFKRSFGSRETVYLRGERVFNMKGKIFSVLRKMKYDK